MYDQFGHAGLEGGRGGGFSAGEAFGDIFGEMFGDIFSGGQRARSQVFRGADLRYELELDLEQAVFGTETEIKIPSLAECKTCKGTGAAKGSTPKTCDTCHGQGQVRMQQSIFTIQQPCPRCKGRGKIISNPCDTCYGQGRVRQEKIIPVSRAGRRRYGGQDSIERAKGRPAATAVRAGDLYVEIRVREHAIFEREGANLSCEVPISFTTAALGGSVEVPTLDGEVVLKIPSETQSGRVFRIREKGVRPVRGGAAGDFFCRVVVETPVSLDAEQKELLKKVRGLAAEGRPQAARTVVFRGREEIFYGCGRVGSRCPESRYSASRGAWANPWFARCARKSPRRAGRLARRRLQLWGALASPDSAIWASDAAIEGAGIAEWRSAATPSGARSGGGGNRFQRAKPRRGTCAGLRRGAGSAAGRHHRHRCAISRADGGDRPGGPVLVAPNTSIGVTAWRRRLSSPARRSARITMSKSARRTTA